MIPPAEKSSSEKKSLISGRNLMIVIGILCIVLMIVTFNVPAAMEPFTTAADYIVVPFQEGLTTIGSRLVSMTVYFSDVKELKEENEKLKEEVASLIEDKTQLQQKNYALRQLEDLYETQSEYSQYEKISAAVIAKDSGNWYHSFVINKGSADGIEKDMNVMAAGGLVGTVTLTGKHWARVETIIDDNSSVSGMFSSSGDTCIVTGNMDSLKTNGTIPVSMISMNASVINNEEVVVSHISDRYLQGILIGYVRDVYVDSSNMQKAAVLVPAVDFEHLDEVLVITVLKETEE